MRHRSAHRPTELNPSGIYIPPPRPEGPSVLVIFAINLAIVILVGLGLYLIGSAQ